MVTLFRILFEDLKGFELDVQYTPSFSTMIRASLLVAIMAALAVGASAFQTTSAPANTCRPTRTSPTPTLLRESKSGDAASKGETAPVTVESFIADKYPEFKALLTKNETLWKLVKEAQTEGCTIFCPTSAAFADLGEKKLKQLLQDERNLETAQRIGSYHVILSDAVPANQLFIEDWTGPKPAPGTQRPIKVGGINTVGGGVPISREKTGGFMGWGAKEDGVAVIGSDNAKILRSLKIGKSIIHETDAFISPQLLWRYLDQLRIPGF
jgi:uncharacterized surface protein with fasciclin (FAS1) repeats